MMASPSRTGEVASTVWTRSNADQISSPSTAVAAILEVNNALSDGAIVHVPIGDDVVDVKSSYTSDSNAIQVRVWITLTSISMIYDDI
jgi:spore germination protein YaaH